MDFAAEALAPLLAQLVNYERTRPDRRLWDLATMRRHLTRLRSPRPAVQVGGSKGKGTTCAFLAGFVQAAGLHAGSYSSPHVTTLLERIQIDGVDITVAQLEPILRRLLNEPVGADERQLTFFEAMTLAAAVWLAERRVDLAIWEVGLGGRHDATSALPVDAAIVTTIELEHTDVLGDTLAQIAGEKAPVIRAGGMGFTGATGVARDVIAAHARACGARLAVLDEQFGMRDVILGADGARGRLWLPDGRELPFHLPGAAAFELPALALAAAAFVQVLPNAALRLDPAPRPALPCRFEVRREDDGEMLVLDGAHTEQSLRAVAAELQRRWPGRRATVLFGCAFGKRWRPALSALLPVADSFVVTELSGTTSEDPAVIAAFLAQAGAQSEVARDAVSGLQRLRSRPGPRLVVGSFYLAGQVRQLILASDRSRNR